MEIILKQDIAQLGHKDDIITVKDGYARNYLIPQGFAINATTSARKILAENIKQRAHKADKIKADAEAFAAQLEGIKLTIATKASKTGKIFGSINTIQLSEAIAKQGLTVDRKTILIKEDSIKDLGSYTAEIKLHREISVKIDFDVVSE